MPLHHAYQTRTEKAYVYHVVPKIDRANGATDDRIKPDILYRLCIFPDSETTHSTRP